MASSGMPRFVAVLALAASLVGALSSCSSSAPTSSGPGLEASVGYSPTRWDAALRAYDDSVVRCMRRHGFSFWSPVDWAYQTAEPHGLFGRRTPAAELEFRRRYAYGVTHRIDILNAEVARNKSTLSNAAYVESLTPERRRVYSTTLADCAHPANDTVLTLRLPDGGKLGEAFGDALTNARDTDEYERWEAAVVGCLKDHSVPVPDGDLANVERAFLVRMLRLIGSKYSTNGDGDIAYEYSARQASRIPAASLERLRQDERATAAVEVRCRLKAGSGAQDAVDSYSAGLASKNPKDVHLLRQLLATKR